MTVTAIREKLHDYISNADDDQIKGLYEIFEDQIELGYDWSTDKDFVAELNDPVKKWEDGSESGMTIEQAKLSLQEMKKRRFED